MNRILLPWLALSTILLLARPEAGHASGTVTNCTEADLRVALRGGGIVTLACDSTISLSSPLLIAKETVLDGTGHSPVITVGFTTNLGPLIVVQPGTGLTLRHLTVTGARVTETNRTSGEDGLAALGGALVIDRAAVTLDGCTFTGNSVTAGPGGGAVNAGADGGNGGRGAGAAIYNNGNLLITNCVFSANTAAAGAGGAGAAGRLVGGSDSGGRGGDGGTATGGAICNSSQGWLNIYDSTFSSNQVTGTSGGLGGAASGILAFTGSPGNAGAALGGAIFNEGGAVSLVNCTFLANAGNGAAGLTGFAGSGTEQPGEGGNGGSALGAGLYNAAGTLTLTNCTFVDNSLVGGPGGTGGTGSTFGFGSDGADGGAGGDALGAGLYTAAGATTVVVSGTFSDNRVSGGSGGTGGAGSSIGHQGDTGDPGHQAGAAIYNGGGTLRVRNSILAYSISGGNAGGAITDEGFNISSDASAAFAAQGSRNQVDPLLGSFSTAASAPTITLSSNSPAINAITPPGGNGSPAFDQRRAFRVEPYDIGAYESDGQFAIPNLSVALALNQVLLSWPAVGDFLVQTTTNVVNTNRWLTLTNQPLTIGSVRGLTVPSTNQAGFYRLTRP